MKKGFYRAMIALLAVPMVGAALTGCDNGKDPGTHEEDQQTDFKSVEIVNKEALASGEWFAKGSIDDLELKVTKKDGTVIDGVALDDLWADELLTLSSSDEAVISTGGGFLTIAGEGTATVTVTLDGVLTDEVTITVLAYDDPIKNKPEMVTTPVAGTAYKFGVEQYGLSTPSMLYLKTTKMASGSYYWATTSTFGEALDVVVEEAATPNGDYKWNLKTEEGGKVTYLGAAASSDSKHVNDTNETTPTTLWKWDAEHKTFLANLEIPEVEGAKPSGDYYLGTSGTFNTLSLSHAETYINKEDSWLGHLYVIPQVMDVLNKEIVLINGVRESEKINVVKPQGDVTFTKKSGDDCVTIGDDGTLTAVANGSCVISVTDGKTTEEVTVTVRDAVKGETQENPFLLADFITEALKLDENGGISKGFYYVKADVKNIASKDKVYFDAKNYIYKLQDATGTPYASVEAMPFFAGDEILVYGQLENYYGTAEMVNTKLLSYTHKEVAITTEVEHATITGLPETGKAMNGSTISFTVSVAEGYEIEKVTVYGGEITDNDGTYSFVLKGAAVINVVTKEAGTASEAVIGSIDLTQGALSATGGTASSNKGSQKSGYWQDSGTKDSDVVSFTLKNSTAYWTTAPKSINFTARLGAGSDKADLDHDVEVVLIDSTGAEISGTKVTVATGLTKEPADYKVSIPTAGTTACAGFKLTHMKEDSWNARYYTLTLSYVAAN